VTAPIAVVGAGAGGLAMAAHLTVGGHAVHLLELPEFEANLAAVRMRGGIALSGVDRTADVMPRLVTTDPARALDGAQLVLISVPAFGHARVVDLIAPHLRDGHAVLFNTGYFAALRFRSALTRGGRRSVIVGESVLLVYAVRKVGPGAVHVDGVKQDLPVAALPARQTPTLISLVATAYPQVSPMRNVLEVSLENLNPMFHPAITLLSLSSLNATAGEYAFYRDGCTPAAGRVIDALDRERRTVGAALGLPDLVPVPTWLQRYYGASGNTTYEAIQSCPAYANFVWPAATAIRYVDEDVPFALVPLASIADELGVPAPVTRSLVDLCGSALARDYWARGPRASDLGLNGVRSADLDRLLDGGER
jgi:opine dehydrogenase